MLPYVDAIAFLACVSSLYKEPRPLSPDKPVCLLGGLLTASCVLDDLVDVSGGLMALCVASVSLDDLLVVPCTHSGA